MILHNTILNYVFVGEHAFQRTAIERNFLLKFVKNAPFLFGVYGGGYRDRTPLWWRVSWQDSTLWWRVSWQDSTLWCRVSWQDSTLGYRDRTPFSDIAAEVDASRTRHLQELSRSALSVGDLVLLLDGVLVVAQQLNQTVHHAANRN